MVVKADQERIKALLKDTITLLCKNGLTFKTEFSIEALIGITLDKGDVFLVNINELVQSELGIKLAAAKAAAEEQAAQEAQEHQNDTRNIPSENESDDSQASSTRRRRRRKRRRSSGQNSQKDFEGDASSGEESSSQSASSKKQARSYNDSNRIVKEEDDDDDESKDIVFIKEEVDDWPSSTQGQNNFSSDLSGIPSHNTMQQQENFDFLHGSSLVPMASQQGGSNMWSDVSQVTPRQNMSQVKRTSTVTSNPSGSSQPGEDPQQAMTRESLMVKSAIMENLGVHEKHRSGVSADGLCHSTCQQEGTVLPSPPTRRSSSGEKENKLHGVGPEDVRLLQSLGALSSVKEEPCDGDQYNIDSIDACIDSVASNVEVQHVETIPLTMCGPRTPDDDQELGSDFFAGVRLPSRKDFIGTNLKASCPVCEKIFVTYQGYMRHIDHHRGRYPFFCNICGRGFMTKDHLGNHTRKHTGERLFCHCGAAFATHQSLRTHKKKEHNDFSITHDQSLN